MELYNLKDKLKNLSENEQQELINSEADKRNQSYDKIIDRLNTLGNGEKIVFNKKIESEPKETHEVPYEKALNEYQTKYNLNLKNINKNKYNVRIDDKEFETLKEEVQDIGLLESHGKYYAEDYYDYSDIENYAKDNFADVKKLMLPEYESNNDLENKINDYNIEVMNNLIGNVQESVLKDKQKELEERLSNNDLAKNHNYIDTLKYDLGQGYENDLATYKNINNSLEDLDKANSFISGIKDIVGNKNAEQIYTSTSKKSTSTYIDIPKKLLKNNELQDYLSEYTNFDVSELPNIDKDNVEIRLANHEVGSHYNENLGYSEDYNSGDFSANYDDFYTYQIDGYLRKIKRRKK